MALEGWVTLAVIAVAIVAMARDIVDSAFALAGALGVLLVAGILPVEQALAGFANPAVAIVALLLVLAVALERSPWMRWLSEVFFGDGGGRRSLVRGLLPVGGLSAFLSNTAVVAALIPMVRDWARRRGATPSKFLMPLSFAAILGGMCTLVGTSTNLVVHGMLMEIGDPGLGMFELARVAAPLALLGIGYLALVGYRLLPAHSDPLEAVSRNPREYVARLRVTSNSPVAGQRVAAFRHLKDLFLAGIEREDGEHSPVRPEEFIRAGDTLLFVGKVDSLAEIAATPGLIAASETEGEVTTQGDGLSHLVEAVVAPSSPIVGRNIREAGFRGRYDAAVLGVHRHGERIIGKIGDIEVRPGDTLLLLTGPDFLPRWRYSRDFYLVSDAGDVPSSLVPADWLEPALLGGVVLVAALGLLPLLHAAVAGVLVLLLSRRLRPADAWSSLNWPTLVTIAASIGLGHALVESGVAGGMTAVITGWAAGLGPAGVVGIVFVTTALLTELVTNVAAAALMFPVAMVAAQQGVLTLHPLAVAVALGASASFLTPVGYQTNTMVAGAAGYRFRDFLKVGLPLKILVLAVGVVGIPILWGV